MSRHQAGIDEFMGARAHVWRETFSRSSASGPTWDRIDAALDDLPERLLAGEASGRVIPPTSGPFGGTTVLVAPADRAEAWLALEGSDVMSAHGGFQRLRVAVEGGSPSLSEVLAELHRKNVLIVPATFCEGPEAMAELRSGVEEHLAQMTAAFLPGLGGRLHLAESAE